MASLSLDNDRRQPVIRHAPPEPPPRRINEAEMDSPTAEGSGNGESETNDRNDSNIIPPVPINPPLTKPDMPVFRSTTVDGASASASITVSPRQTAQDAVALAFSNLEDAIIERDRNASSSTDPSNYVEWRNVQATIDSERIEHRTSDLS